jgi:hypothetical protein
VFSLRGERRDNYGDRMTPQRADGQPWCDCGTWDTTVHGEQGYEVCDTLRALASPYAGHHDYREEWKP